MKREPEPDDAGDGDVAPHQPGEPAGDREPQAGAPLAPGQRLIDLEELAKTLFEVGLGDADAGVDDGDRQRAAAASAVTCTVPVSVNLMALPIRLVRICRTPIDVAADARQAAPGA